MGLRMFLRNWNEFATKIEFGIVLEYFCTIDAGLGIFSSKEAKGNKGVGLVIVCPSKSDKKSKVKQVRRGVRSPVRYAGK